MAFIAFLIAAIVLAITPGPGLAYVVARTVAGGRSEGMASCLGTAVGGLVHVAAAYLIYLGVRLLFREGEAGGVAPVASHGARRAFREGVLVEALNVKTALFFLAFLPQFVSPGHALIPQLAMLGSICVVLNTLVDVGAVLAASRLLKSSAARVARARMLTRTSGVVMLALGGYLAFARRAIPS